MSKINQYVRLHSVIIKITVIALFVYSCKATDTLMVSSLEPAPVGLSKGIRRIGVINEACSNADIQAPASFDELVNAQDLQMQEEGKAAAINGLFGELLKDKRFDTVLLLSTFPKAPSYNKDLVREIPWDALKKSCIEHNLDAIFSLAFYETETKVSNRRSTMEALDLMRVKVSLPAREVTLETLIENGWRIYDPFNRKVLDEIRFNEQLIVSAKGEDPLKALQSIADRKDSLLVKSSGSGSAYGMRLKPSNRKLKRPYFVKGSDHLSKAAAAVTEKDWMEAARLWQLDCVNEKAKVRAMACHNMAVLHELKGDLPKAIEWATKANEHEAIKITKHYLEALEHQISQHKLAMEQLENTVLLEYE